MKIITGKIGDDYLVYDLRTLQEERLTKEAVYARKDDIAGVSADDIMIYESVAEWLESYLVTQEMIGEDFCGVKFRVGKEDMTVRRMTTGFDYMNFTEDLREYISMSGTSDNCTAFINRVAEENKGVFRFPSFVRGIDYLSTNQALDVKVFDGRGVYGLLASYSFAHTPTLETLYTPVGHSIEEGLCANSAVKHVEINVACEPGDERKIEIKSKAFTHCKQLQSVVFNGTVYKLGSNCFKNCEALKKITLPEGLEHIGASCFEESGLRHVHTPATLRLLNNAAFASCKRLTAVRLHKNLEAIGNGCFANCDKLTQLRLPPNLETIGYRAFPPDIELVVPRNSATSKLLESKQAEGQLHPCRVRQI